ncbi:glucose-6-phosphate isomerase [Patescibacteria group bacterium]|nr:glucose-6-phosphate isomerase [Patescibacteria group bacterium]MBU1702814.1 glucose-6-phosphate isomerase [Patescibacteria group bacterium]MBU1953793.1 glucose-6-phosphate isomerase [Patescibacteria group bacterium]
MITLTTENLEKIAAEHGLAAGDIEKGSALIPGYLKNIESKNQGFYKVIDDPTLIEKINSFAVNTAGKFDHFVVLGIGGSALGTIALQQGLTHLFAPSKLHVLDNIDPVIIKEIQDAIDLKRTLFIVVTKSGTTPETISQYMYFRNLCQNSDLKVSDHFLFITDPDQGLLRKIATEEGILTFEVPENVGGRFSVLTAVSLLPARLINLKIENIMAGAKNMRTAFLSENPNENLPFRLASIQYLLYNKGKTINVMMPYAQKLIRFTDWYRQLLAESIGKNGVGITPVNALGATDQHSQSQLWNDGPNDKLHIFIKVEKPAVDANIPNLHPQEESLKYLNNVSFNKLLLTEMEGTAQSLTKNDRPNIEIAIDKINEETLGGLFMLFESTTSFLGEFFGVNAFNQPGVELSKQITKKLLS